MLIERVVIRPGAHLVVRHGVEHPAEDLGVGARGGVPQAEEAVGERVRDGVVPFGVEVVEVVVCAGGDGLGIGGGGGHVLGGDQAEVFAGELPAQRGCESGGAEGEAVEGGGERGGVLDDDGDFGVVRAELGAVVQVRGAADYGLVVGDEDLFGGCQYVCVLIWQQVGGCRQCTLECT